MNLFLVPKWSLEKLKKSEFGFQNKPRKYLSISLSLSEVFTSMASLIQLLCVSCRGQEAILSGVFVILLSFRTSCGWTNYTIHPGVCACDNPPVPDCLVDQGAI